ncbi:hypothetical protein TNIN_186651 [Trichonephila inaurata madagascariensis]|uniref:Uncharacterized protein n=1 Tax=Trichonephila inaurata madagascariensis TaxID=2747483 RepID=A0A8X6MC90_9ARAC|nr:hypothetical protein TNIN_186651 [Trichonephila inaurata madagascariensis]
MSLFIAYSQLISQPKLISYCKLKCQFSGNVTNAGDQDINLSGEHFNVSFTCKRSRRVLNFNTPFPIESALKVRELDLGACVVLIHFEDS